MIYSIVNGGLGNQLFQYAAARGLAVLNNSDVCLLIESYKTFKLFPFLLDKLELPIIIKDNIVNDPNRESLYILREGLPAKSLLPYFTDRYKDSSVLLEGYWQDPRYFDGIKDLLYKEIIKTPLHNDRVDCAIHIRRNDRLDEKTQKIYGVFAPDYYRYAVAMMEDVSGGNIEHYSIYTDDVQWASEYRDYIIYNGKPTTIKHTGPIYDLIDLACCDHFIIPNSSFSWWSAWLSKKNLNKKVICPDKWAFDIIHNSPHIQPKDDPDWFQISV